MRTQRAATNTIARPAATLDNGPIQHPVDDAEYQRESERLSKLHEKAAALQIEKQTIVAGITRYAHVADTPKPTPDIVALALGEIEATSEAKPRTQSRLEQVESELWRLREPIRIQNERVEHATRRASRRVAVSRKADRLAMLRRIREAMQELGASIDALRADDDALDAAGVTRATGFGSPLALAPGQCGGFASVNGEPSRLSRLVADLDSEISGVEGHQC